jgi:hypothetical protein
MGFETLPQQDSTEVSNLAHCLLKTVQAQTMLAAKKRLGGIDYWLVLLLFPEE